MYKEEKYMTSKRRSKMAVFGRITQILLLVLGFSSCEWGIPDYKVTVIIEEGVTGTPEAGEYAHKELTTLSFDYNAIDPIHTVEVFINNIRQIASGSITVYTNFTLTARLVDIRGSWNIKMQWADSLGVDFDFSITFDGTDLASGTFTDSQGYHGLWTAEKGIITITYTDWSDFVLTGSVFNMSGTFTAESDNGSWTATRLS
jgi:hypothetical protein